MIKVEKLFHFHWLKDKMSNNMPALIVKIILHKKNIIPTMY